MVVGSLPPLGLSTAKIVPSAAISDPEVSDLEAPRINVRRRYSSFLEDRMFGIKLIIATVRSMPNF